MLPSLRRTVITAVVLLTIASVVSLIALWIQPDPQVARIVGTVSVAPLLLSGLLLRRTNQ